VIGVVQANGAVSEPAGAPLVADLPAAEPVEEEESYEWVSRIGLELLAPRPKPLPRWRIPLALGIAGGLVLLAVLLYSGILQRYFESGVPQQTSSLASTSPSTLNDLQPLPDRLASRPADPVALVELGREYTRRQDWTKAEAAYRAAVEVSPSNRDAAYGLSDVLYQQQRYEESAAAINRLSSGKSQN
jgi:cytochrome c-type biogenesis protein CcmH/NrfG